VYCRSRTLSLVELVREGPVFAGFSLSLQELKEGWQRSTEGGGRHGDHRAGGEKGRQMQLEKQV